MHVPLDDDGLVPEALEAALERLAAAGRRVKLLYTVPNHHNPAGVTLSAERRPRIVEIARRYGVLVLEDDPYGLLGFDGDPLPSLHSHDPESVVYLGSFSKTFAPGFRVGWAVAPHAVREKLVLASEAAILCPSAFSQLAVATYLEDHDWKHQVGVFRDLYRERAGATLEALADLVPAARWTTPHGGFYVWVTLPDGLDATAMLPRAVTERVAYVPGTAFYADGQGRQSLAPLVLLPDLRPDPGGHPPPRDRGRGGDRTADHLRPGRPAPAERRLAPGPRLPRSRSHLTPPSSSPECLP